MYNYITFLFKKNKKIGDWGFGDWGLGPFPHPQPPTPHPQSPILY